ncbi:MAG: hypothetical protein J0H57_10130, partial [Rhodospirillales bacterium]|nr:hypothetical protein [Rhodospirillales bacterium]
SPAPASPATAGQSQLDRIEGKPDEGLRRLDQLRSPPSGAAQGQATAAGGAAIPSPAPSAAPAASPAAYKPGALAIAHVAPKDINSLSEIPPDSVGGFVYEGGSIAFTDIRTRGVRYAGPVAVELQGWLKAKEAGRYEIGTDLSAHFALGSVIAPTCYLQAWLEGRSLDQRSVLVSHPGSQQAEASLVLGAELQPGLYRLRVWTACTAPQGVNTTSELLLKAPSELNLRPVTGSDLLHREE